MSETSPTPEQQPEKKKLDPHVRFHALLSEEFTIEVSGIEQRNIVDYWRGLRSQFIHELTWLGISQEGFLGHDVAVAKPDDRSELFKILLNLLAKNQFKSSHSMALHFDHATIVQECDIKIGSAFWSMRQPFEEYWQGHYRSDKSRLALLKRVIADEKKNEDSWPVEDRAWQWIESYFLGCCPKDIQVPQGQNPDEVLEVFDADLELLSQLNVSEGERKEMERHLKLDFIRGEYPIVLGMEDSDSEQAMLEVVTQMAAESSETSGRMSLRSTGITMVLQRYRRYVAQGLNFLDEEIKRKSEMEPQDTMFKKDLERRQRDFEIEAAFLGTLMPPEWEAQEWPEALLRSANTPYFKINPAYRTHVHGYIRWLAANIPDEEQYPGEDPWDTLTHMLHNYWSGNYYPDQLRWEVLQNECKRNEDAGLKDSNSRYLLHKKFIEGCSEESAKINARQDTAILRSAYDNDIKLIRSLGLSDEVVERTELAYNMWLLEGKMPLTPEREKPSDREELQRRLREHIEKTVGSEWEINPVLILDELNAHWHVMSKRSVPRKQK